MCKRPDAAAAGIPLGATTARGGATTADDADGDDVVDAGDVAGAVVDGDDVVGDVVVGDDVDGDDVVGDDVVGGDDDEWRAAKPPATASAATATIEAAAATENRRRDGGPAIAGARAAANTFITSASDGRASGFLASIASSSRSIAGRRFGAREDGDGGAWSRCCAMISIAAPVENGGSPVNISNAITPSE